MSEENYGHLEIKLKELIHKKNLNRYKLSLKDSTGVLRLAKPCVTNRIKREEAHDN